MIHMQQKSTKLMLANEDYDKNQRVMNYISDFQDSSTMKSKPKSCYTWVWNAKIWNKEVPLLATQMIVVLLTEETHVE